MKISVLAIGICLLVSTTHAEVNDIVIDFAGPGDSTNSIPQNWHHLDPSEGSYKGISLLKAYEEKLKGKESKKIIVAVIDSGIDIEHEDLDDVIWVNEDEVPDNNLDDDGNGYVDDVNGWNFLGGKDGQNISHESLEITRLLVKFDKKYKDVEKADLSGKKRKEYEYYQKIKKAFDKEVAEAEMSYANIQQLSQTYFQAREILEEELGDKELSLEMIENLEVEGQEKEYAKNFLIIALSNQLNDEELKTYEEVYRNKLEFQLNPEFDAREIVGDDLDDLSQRNYGNNDVIGPDPKHGTHVAGIIAAERNNSLGVDGVADNVSIMVVRAVPDGDERDKDVANAIYYAVDNGAHIINMSFGKSYSPNKKVVDKAVKYAQKKGVLLIHAAGNDGEDIDEEDNFPTRYLKTSHSGKEVKNWIEVGASSWQSSGNFVAPFSNFGNNSVDVFAPGVQIYSTVPDQQYANLDGTSMAAPVVSGLAALLMSYYPDLDYKEVKDIIIQSAALYKDDKVTQPGSENMISFGNLSQTGGIINVYNAVSLAEKRASN